VPERGKWDGSILEEKSREIIEMMRSGMSRLSLRGAEQSQDRWIATVDTTSQ